MNSENKSNCHTCPMHSSCEPAGTGDELSGWPLVGQAAVYFLIPLVAAIAAAAVVEGENVRILAGVTAFIVTAATAAIIGILMRRRRKVSQ